MSTFQLEILTPQRKFFSDTVEMIVFKTTDGERGVKARNYPTIFNVDTGIIKIKTSEGELNALLTEGLMLVTKEKVTVTVDAAEWPEEIDLVRAEGSLKRAEDRLKLEKEKVDSERAKASMKRALSRIKVSKVTSGLSQEKKQKMIVDNE